MGAPEAVRLTKVMESVSQATASASTSSLGQIVLWLLALTLATVASACKASAPAIQDFMDLAASSSHAKQGVRSTVFVTRAHASATPIILAKLARSVVALMSARGKATA